MVRPKMCSFFAFVTLIAFVSAAKERVSDQSLDQLTSKLWHEIEKRLKEDEGVLSDEERNVLSQFGDDSKDEKCHYDSLNGTIVRTHDSQARGAKFLNSIDSDTDADLDMESCLQACCDEAMCNLAVFKNKEPDHSCYLFDCGSPSVCLFTEHPGFSSHSLPNRRNGNKEQEKHADELEDLAAATTTTSTTEPTTTTTTQQATLPPKKVLTPVALFGECSDHQDCAGSNTECLAGYCLCQEGFHAQDAMCRKDCTRFEFECANEGQPAAYPQCIAIYDKCDGTIHCKDGSDEVNCDTSQTQGFGYESAAQPQPAALPPPRLQQPQPPAPSKPVRPQQPDPIVPQSAPAPQPQPQNPYYDQTDFQSQSYADQLWNYGNKAQPPNLAQQAQQVPQYPQKPVKPPPRRVNRPVVSTPPPEVHTLPPHAAPERPLESPQSSFNAPSAHSVGRKPGPLKPPAYQDQQLPPSHQQPPPKAQIPPQRKTESYPPKVASPEVPLLTKADRNRGGYNPNYGGISDGGRVGPQDGNYNSRGGSGYNMGAAGRGYKLSNSDGYAVDGGGRGYGYGYGNRYGNPPDYRYYDTGGQGMWNNGPSNIDYDYYNVDPEPKADTSDVSKLNEDAISDPALSAVTPPLPLPPVSHRPHTKIQTPPPTTPSIPQEDTKEEAKEEMEQSLQKIDDGGIAAPNALEQSEHSNSKVEIITDKLDIIEEEKVVPKVNNAEPIKTQTSEQNAIITAISSQGAVISLALGLAITAILLVFVGCRLRHMKHRLRKGRPLNSNEADYLINGMYL
ncbi:hypothetical protein CAPTEDRAFT_225456 [Capitella teleta]|uniref:MANSC domain-containing protein n=1 Tax=Capitella teleta TaxID=283909 RepID=R7VD53_CAPTE|nr:hypothetical protein CAPTEDRAFT_225456 [Capitella teleta]|eukprot:ELU16574.1 hypothetical protein CAPTEDRAFT_225456 [Capitella teleta]